MSYIDDVIRKICNREGGYTDDPQDAGGPTKYGITQATLKAWRHADVSANDVQNLTLEDACEIYKKLYVEKPGFLLLNDEPLAEQLIDAGVNHGVRTACKMFQRAVGVDDDGVIGPDTIEAYKAASPHWKAYTKFKANRLKYYGDIIRDKPTQAKFAAGWMNRCSEMIDIYVAAVTIDVAVEERMLSVSKLGRKQAHAIQDDSSVRKNSADLFEKLESQMKLV